MDQTQKRKIVNFLAFVGLIGLIFAFDVYMYKTQNAKKLKNLSNGSQGMFSAKDDFRGTSSDISGLIIDEEEVIDQQPEKIPSSIPTSEQSPIAETILSVKESATINSQDQKILGITFEYPVKIFIINPSNNGILLSSQYSFVSNPSGLEGKQMIHNFSVSFQAVSKNILDTIKNDLPYAFETLFPKKNEDSFVDSPGYAKRVQVGSYFGYEVNEGAEGLNVRHVYLKIASQKTLMIKLRFIGDNLHPRISQTQQEEIFTKILESIK